MTLVHPRETITSIKEIPNALKKVFKALEGNYTRSTSANRILLATPGMDVAEIYEFIDSLATTQPGRFFVLTADPNRDILEANISAYCHQLSKGRAICSEVICLHFGDADSSSIPSVVRAHLLTGRRTELIILGDAVISAQFKCYAELADILIINSQYHWQHDDILKNHGDVFQQVVDVQWLLLVPWREAIRNFFDSLVPNDRLEYVEEVHISGSPDLIVQPLLLVGWICLCLK